MQYAIGNDGTTAPITGWSEDIPTAKNTGTYYVWYKAKGDENHLDSDPKCVSVVIKKESVKPEVPTDKLVYNGKDQPLVEAGKAEGGTLFYAIGKDGKTAPTEGWGETVPTGKNAGTYYVWYKVKGDKNHNDTDPVALEVEIAKKPLVVTAEDKAKTYGDADPELTWTQEGLVEGDALAVTLKRAEGENVGGHTITVDKFEASDNYDQGFNEAVLTITAREATVTALDQTITEGESISTDPSMAKLSGQAEGDTLRAITLTATAANAANATGTIIAGNAIIFNDEGVETTGNYSITYVPGKLTVNP
ncbi:MAG: MBG domain-containing protein, partial [Eubacteriales bacterium]